ncbi:MAG TPA: hypothetical protein PLF81_12610 [Candidatus Anammoximicrobium sp.]|nr:hypothetical protein [Candidatus Anammoximicrobium sp.]
MINTPKTASNSFWFRRKKLSGLDMLELPQILEKVLLPRPKVLNRDAIGVEARALDLQKKSVPAPFTQPIGTEADNLNLP